MTTKRFGYKVTRLNDFIRAFTLILVALVLTGCGHYWSKFTFRGIRNGIAPPTTRALVIDSGLVRDRIHAEELRQADESQRIRELPPPKPKDAAATKAWLEAYDRLVDLQARAAFLSDLKGMATFDVPATAQGIVVMRRWADPGDSVQRHALHLTRFGSSFEQSVGLLRVGSARIPLRCCITSIFSGRRERPSLPCGACLPTFFE